MINRSPLHLLACLLQTGFWSPPTMPHSQSIHTTCSYMRNVLVHRYSQTCTQAYAHTYHAETRVHIYTYIHTPTAMRTHTHSQALVSQPSTLGPLLVA